MNPRAAVVLLLALGLSFVVSAKTTKKVSKAKPHHGKKAAPLFGSGNAGTFGPVYPSDVLNLTSWALQETNLAVALTYKQAYNLTGYADSRFFLNTSTGGVSMVVNGSPVNDPDGNPSPRTEMLYTNYFSSADSNYHSMNFTMAVMSFMPGAPAKSWTSIAQVFRNGGTCGKGAGIMVRATTNGNTTNTGQIYLTGKTDYNLAAGVVTIVPSYVIGTKFTFGIVINAGTIKFFYNNMVTPVYTAQLVLPCDINAFKVGNYYLQSALGPATSTAAVQLYSLNVQV